MIIYFILSLQYGQLGNGIQYFEYDFKNLSKFCTDFLYKLALNHS